ncbi:MAG: cupin domain-containing protein [Pseudomonadota bacterium]
MTIESGNIFDSIPSDLEQEAFLKILNKKNIRIERIVSNGQSSPAQGWYDQEDNEWVIVLEGQATIVFEKDKKTIHLKKGDYLNIPSHTKHKVAWTDPAKRTIWLAIHY